MKFLKSKWILQNLLGVLLVLGFYPLLALLCMDHSFLQGPEWGLWMLFYFFLTVTFVFYTVTKLFFIRSDQLYKILYLNLLVALSVVLKVIPLPLGMSLGFVIPILTAGVLHPYWGSLVGFFMVLLSALISGGVGPWTPIQVYLFVMISALLIWVPRSIRSRKMFMLLYGVAWGLLYGFMMSLYFWPVVSKPVQEESQWRSFLFFYISTSLLWDLFRALGNGLFIAVLYGPFQRTIGASAALVKSKE